MDNLPIYPDGLFIIYTDGLFSYLSTSLYRRTASVPIETYLYRPIHIGRLVGWMVCLRRWAALPGEHVWDRGGRALRDYDPGVAELL